MQTIEAIESRRNVRSYTDQVISNQDLDTILEAGRRAPSASNTQPWDFVVVTNREKLVEPRPGKVRVTSLSRLRPLFSSHQLLLMSAEN
jgi:hypothetical protein